MDTCQGGAASGNSCQSEAQGQEVRLRENLSHIRRKLLVMSGKGGVGKSSVAVHLALALANLGHRVGLLDVDLHGPSIARMLGLKGMLGSDEDKGCLIPQSYNDRLKVVSIECLLEDRDSAIIWRGPLKHGVIKQFIAEVDWGDLDFLVIDSPPGTGDEPMSVAQSIPDAEAIIVTTPQEIALADVRKSINFCRTMHMAILGLVENMSGFVCPHCGEALDLFSTGGGARTAKEMRILFLGKLPIDPRVVENADKGKTVLDDSGPFSQALADVADRVLAGMAGL